MMVGAFLIACASESVVLEVCLNQPPNFGKTRLGVTNVIVEREREREIERERDHHYRLAHIVLNMYLFREIWDVVFLKLIWSIQNFITIFFITANIDNIQSTLHRVQQ